MFHITHRAKQVPARGFEVKRENIGDLAGRQLLKAFCRDIRCVVIINKGAGQVVFIIRNPE